MTVGPQDLAGRVHTLAAAHGWMDAPTTLTLASAPISNTQMLGAADVMRQALITTWDGFSHAFDDPVLTKPPTATLIARARVQNSMGRYPVDDSHVQAVQAGLAGKGFGLGLPQGVWDPAWNQALYAYTNQQLQDRYAGDEPAKASVSTHSILHAILSDLAPSKVADAVIGTVKSVPGLFRSLAADVGGSVAANVDRASRGGWAGVAGGLGLLGNAITPVQGIVQQASGGNRNIEAANKVGAAVESVGRAKGDLSQADYVARLGLGRALNDVGTMLMFVPGLGEASASAKALRTGMRVFTDNPDSLSVAARAGGVITNSLRPTLDATVKPGLAAKMIVRGTPDEVTGGLLGGKWLSNLPILSRTGPVVAKALGDDGWVYRSRMSPKVLHAQVYARPLVRDLGNAATRGLYAGGALRAGVQAENTLAPTPESRRILSEDSAPGWLDWTVLLLHPTPGSVGAPSVRAAAAFDRLRRLHQATPPGVTAAMDDAIRYVARRTDIGAKDWNDLVTQVEAGDEGAKLWLNSRLSDIAAATLAEQRLPADPRFAHLADVGFSDEKTAALQTLAHEAAWLNPAAHAAQAHDLASRPDELTAKLVGEIVNHMVRPGATLGGQINDYLAAGEQLRQANRAGLLAHLITPATRARLKDLRAEQRLAKGLEQPGPEVRPGSAAWREANLSQPAGSVGLMRTDTLDRNQALAAADALEARLQAALQISGDPDAQLEAVNRVSRDAAQFLFTQFGQDARTMEGLGSAEALVRYVRQRAGNLAVPVYPARNAPQPLHDAIAAIEARGYKLVFGTDIGHAWSDSLPDLPELGGAVTAGRKAARALALSGEKFADSSISAIKRSAVRLELQKAVNDGKITLPPLYTVDTAMRDLTDGSILPSERKLAALQSLANFAGVRFGRVGTNAVRLAKLTGQSEEDVTNALHQEVLAGMGMRDLRLSTVKKILGRTDDVPWTTEAARSEGGELTMPLMDRKSIAEAYRAIQKGMSASPTYMVGAARLNDVARRLAVPVGKPVGAVFPSAAAVVEGLPPRVMNAVLRYRFSTSPMFSVRRVVKTNLKLQADGVPGVWDPLKTMAERDTFDHDRAVLNRVYPESHKQFGDGVDAAVREVMQADAFGMYNARWYEMYAAGEWARQGLSDDQIRRKLVRVFTYGSGGRDARSALERSMNTVFFPFSFERTLYRNIGGYLMDRPVQLLAIAAGVQTWRAIHDHTEFGKWVDAHLPILQDLTTLNAFAHGASLGQIGGVYAPAINLFMPQHWTSAKGAVEGASKMVPLWADFNRQFIGYNPKTGTLAPGKNGTLVAQALIGLRGASNLAAHGLQVAGLISEPAAWAQAHPAMTFNSQLDAAYALRTALYAHYATFLAANEKANSAAAEYTFPDDPALPATVRGKPITKVNIGFLVHAKFPAYDPLKGQQTAQSAALVVDQWLGKVRETHPADYAAYSGFVAQSRKAARYLNAGSYTDAQAAQATTAFRAWAQAAAKDDPDFRTFYADQFAWLWGPLSLDDKDVGL